MEEKDPSKTSQALEILLTFLLLGTETVALFAIELFVLPRHPARFLPWHIFLAVGGVVLATGYHAVLLAQRERGHPRPVRAALAASAVAAAVGIADYLWTPQGISAAVGIGLALVVYALGLIVRTAKEDADKRRERKEETAAKRTRLRTRKGGLP